PPSRRKAAVRRGRKVQATPSVKAKSGNAEGQERPGTPLRQGGKQRCMASGLRGCFYVIAGVCIYEGCDECDKEHPEKCTEYLELILED
ncbi:MAG: hypothetical protein IKF90_15230, partial [Parasporobacterium sp.]|nr:hypothetical protein [Parasporobacterium sp.]